MACLICGEEHGGLMCPKTFTGPTIPDGPSIPPLYWIQMPLTPEQDRERRIRELAREWTGRAAFYSVKHERYATPDNAELEFFMKEAVRAIDALDAAVIPPRGTEK